MSNLKGLLELYLYADISKYLATNSGLYEPAYRNTFFMYTYKYADYLIVVSI